MEDDSLKRVAQEAKQLRYTSMLDVDDTKQMTSGMVEVEPNADERQI